jgi:cell division protein FtsW (lipid II flippase)
MQRIFPIINRESQVDRLQSRLMIIATLSLLTYSIVLSLAPILRTHSDLQQSNFSHWIGFGVWVVCFAFLHHQTTRKLPKHDPYLLPIIGMLSGIGLMTIWRLYPNLGLRQTTWLALACLLFFLGVQFPVYLGFLRRYKYLWLLAGLVMTGLTVLVGINPSGSGPALWLELFGIHFQPSEFLKLLLIVFLAGYFGDKSRITTRIMDSVIPTLIVIFTAILLLIFQRDLGTASIFLLVYLAILISAKQDRVILWLAPGLFIALGLAGYALTETVRSRIDTWLNPFGDPTGSSYQIVQSLIAIAEGSLMGSGPGLGSPNLIPVAVSDFIYAAIAEELGFAGALTIIALIILLVYRGYQISKRTEDAFQRFLVLGLIFYIGTQSALIIGGNIGLLPLTGVTLPFVSYGGSSLLVTFLTALMLLSVSDKVAPAPQENRSLHIHPRLISSLLIGLLLIEILVTSFFSFWARDYLVERPENIRWIIDDRYVSRGEILDRRNQVIVTNTGMPGTYERSSNYSPLYSVIGYTNPTYGQTGIEDALFDYLRGYSGYPFSTLFTHDLFYNQPPEGLDVRLTLDLQLQRRADLLLADALNEDEGGAIVLINAQSGEILSMSSHPFFDAANLEEQWSVLSEDPSAPFLNRAAQGLYPAGPALLPFMLVSEIDLILDVPNPEELITTPPATQSCALQITSEPSWNELISNGCQETFLDLVSLIDAPSMTATFDIFGFFHEPQIYLETAGASSSLESQDSLTLVEKFQISPLQAAIAASTLTHQGTRPGPRIVNAYQDPEGEWVILPKFESSEQVLTPNQAATVVELLKYPEDPLWGVTATSATQDGKTVTWFIGGTTSNRQGQPLVAVVLLEKDAPREAINIGQALLEQK